MGVWGVFDESDTHVVGKLAESLTKTGERVMALSTWDGVRQERYKVFE
jgi:hypothetical protein